MDDMLKKAQAEAERLKAQGWTQKDFADALESVWNPRYVLWAKKHGLTPEQMIEKDQKDWPGGCMTGFSLWIQAEVKEICKFYGYDKADLRLIAFKCGDNIHKVFDQWLEMRIM